MYERILVPLDGSEVAEVALPCAEELAGRLGSEIILMHVGESADSLRRMEPYIQKILEATRKGAERYPIKSGVKPLKIESVIAVGHPAEEIVDYAEKENIGLIIMATHGRSGIRRWALGSVADKVIRATKRPVALIRAEGVRPDIRERGILNKVLVSLDGSKQSETILPYIEELASTLKTEVVLLHVLSPSHYIYAAEGGAVKVKYTEAEIKQLETNAEDYLNKVAGGLKKKGITAKLEVAVGNEAEKIITMADEIGADIVAMSTHGRSGLGRLVLGSVADRILHEGKTPLLLVRAAPRQDI